MTESERLQSTFNRRGTSHHLAYPSGAPGFCDEKPQRAHNDHTKLISKHLRGIAKEIGVSSQFGNIMILHLA